MSTYSNQEIADLLTNIATAYEIKNKNYFRIISYQNAADTINTYPQSIYQIWHQDKLQLDAIPNIGPTILKKLDYWFTHGRYHPAVIKAFKNIHPAVFTFTKINGIGPKIAYKLTQNFTFPRRDPVKAVEKLILLAQKGKIKNLPRFGQKSEHMILTNAQSFLGRVEKMPLAVAQNHATAIITYLHQALPAVKIIEPLGSLRRQAPTVGDIDLAIQSHQPQPIISVFVNYPGAYQIVAQGPKKASLKIQNDIRIDLMVQSAKTWGSLLQHFTGSKQHNIDLRKYAQTLGYSLSEYGIKDIKNGQIHTFTNEVDFYHFLGLDYIEPSDRLGENEIVAAKKRYTKLST